ncbi:MAG TPA: InlB B-repeat-containing protein [Candidatus Mediterraneibacter merdipullorum]|nr:InlB B-repeat-containing protein [Candidatus Mediterraneibacter merdipullorum]
MYAGWAPEDRTVYFDVQADAGEISAVPEAQSVRAGECAVEPETPKREGYRFAGWFREPQEVLGMEAVSGQRQTVRLAKEKSGNTYTIRYKKKESWGAEDSGAGRNPDTGVRDHAAWWVAMAAAGIGGVIYVHTFRKIS